MTPPRPHLFLESELVLGIWDAFPVSDGHALLVPRRHIATWFDATADERHALTDAIDAARTAILERHRPDGFNIGVNVGEAAARRSPTCTFTSSRAMPATFRIRAAAFDTSSQAAATTWRSRGSMG